MMRKSRYALFGDIRSERWKHAQRHTQKLHHGNAIKATKTTRMHCTREMWLENVETKMPAHFNMCSCAFIIKRATQSKRWRPNEPRVWASKNCELEMEWCSVRMHVITILVWLLDSAFSMAILLREHFVIAMVHVRPKFTIHIESSLWSAQMELSSSRR